jgi:hypothetical protein
MSIFSGGSIPTNDLLFLYDRDNVTKSWNGKPTTNVHPETVGGMQGITYTYVGVEDGWKKYSISGTWASGTYPYSCYLSPSSFSAGVRYSVAATMKTNVPHKFNGNFTYINYVNAPKDDEGSGGYNILEDGSHRPFRKGFAYTSTTNQNGYLDSRPTANGTSFNSSTDFFYIKDIQAEVGEFPTPYVDATRSNTQSLKDISDTAHTVTSSSLTYTDDGSFEFDGTSNYVSLPNDLGYTNEVSVVAWIKTSGTPAGSYHIVCGGANLEISIPHSGGALRFGVSTTTGRHVGNRGSGLNDGNWHQVVITFGGASLKGYIDGVQAGTTITTTGGLVSSFANRRLGQFGNDASYWMNGEIAVYGVYKKVFSASEITQLFEAKRGRFGI